MTGVVAVGADDEAMLFGGLGSDGKNASVAPFGSVVPFAVGDPIRKEKIRLNVFFLFPLTPSGIIITEFSFFASGKMERKISRDHLQD